jgi:hypothetical protein
MIPAPGIETQAQCRLADEYEAARRGSSPTRIVGGGQIDGKPIEHQEPIPGIAGGAPVTDAE